MKSLVEIILQAINKPVAPIVGFLKLYPKADKNLYILDSDNNESKIAKYEDTQNLTNTNIAAGAGIEESKLALDYRTAWLKNYTESLLVGYEEVIVGNGIASSWNINHDLGFKYVNANFYLVATDEEIDMGNVPVDNANTLVTGIVLGAGEQVRVVVKG